MYPMRCSPRNIQNSKKQQIDILGFSREAINLNQSTNTNLLVLPDHSTRKWSWMVPQGWGW